MLNRGDVRQTMGGEPTFISASDMDAPEWNTDALGPTKRAYAHRLLRRLKDRWTSGAVLNLSTVEPVLKRAFTADRLAAVALLINSPGGAPTQSALIADRIRGLAEEHDVPVLAFCEDVAASGGYWLACAADEIYAHETSMVGSIGVITSSWQSVSSLWSGSPTMKSCLTPRVSHARRAHAAWSSTWSCLDVTPSARMQATGTPRAAQSVTACSTWSVPTRI